MTERKQATLVWKFRGPVWRIISYEFSRVPEKTKIHLDKFEEVLT
jgi:hypothetical protein